MKKVVSTSVFILCTNFVFCQGYYVDNGSGNPSHVDGEIPDHLKVKEWAMYYFRKDCAEKERKCRWGKVSDKSLGELMKRHEKQIEWEQRFPNEKRQMVYSNYIGPVAVIDKNKTNTAEDQEFTSSQKNLNKAIEYVKQLNEYFKAYKEFNKAYQFLIKNKTAFPNPYKQVGAILKDYTKVLTTAKKNVTTLKRNLNEINSKGSKDIDRQLQDIQANFSLLGAYNARLHYFLKIDDVEDEKNKKSNQ